MKNIQPIESLRSDPNTLDVHSIYYTLQGEAIHAGRPAVFLRLAGCNLQCIGCDTDYTTNRKTMNIADVVEELSKYPTRLIVITGGEPFRQNFHLLIDAMPHHEFQIETNGSLCPQWIQERIGNAMPIVKVVISPKSPVINQFWADTNPDYVMFKYVMNYKYVGKDTGLPTSVLGKAKMMPARPPGPQFRIYLQPEDTGKTFANKQNVKACIDSCMKHGYTLCLQLHKMIGLP